MCQLSKSKAYFFLLINTGYVSFSVGNRWIAYSGWGISPFPTATTTVGLQH